LEGARLVPDLFYREVCKPVLLQLPPELSNVLGPDAFRQSLAKRNQGREMAAKAWSEDRVSCWAGPPANTEHRGRQPVCAQVSMGRRFILS